MFNFKVCTRCHRTRTQPLTIGFLDCDGGHQSEQVTVCARCRGLAGFENSAGRRRGAYSAAAVSAVPPWR